MEIRIGTSGYSFDDWMENFYPQGTAKGKMLDYYVRHFPTVEINSTYYRIPSPMAMNTMAKKAPEGFDFIIKVPQTFTHQRMNLESDLTKYCKAVKPIEDSGKLSGLLAQFPYSFKFNQNNLDYICIINNLLSPRSLFVEFRHNSWVNRNMYDRLRNEGIGYVCVDEPPLNGLLNPDCFATTDTAYIRLHGRNAREWWNGGALRYDYNYSKDELEEWRLKLIKLEEKKKVNKVYMFFNNCHAGHAVSNALGMNHIINV